MSFILYLTKTKNTCTRFALNNMGGGQMSVFQLFWWAIVRWATARWATVRWATVRWATVLAPQLFTMWKNIDRCCKNNHRQPNSICR